MQIFLFIALIISILAVVFAVQNTEMTRVSFAIWETEYPLAVVLLVALAAGALISFLFSLPSNIRARWAIRQQKKKMTELDTQLKDSQTKLASAQTEIATLKTPAVPIVSVPPAPSQPAPVVPAPAPVEPVPAVETPAFIESGPAVAIPAPEESATDAPIELPGPEISEKPDATKTKKPFSFF